MSTDIARLQTGGYLVLNHRPEEVQSIIDRSVGEGAELTEFDLPRVKIPSGGGRTWELPGLAGVESTTDLQGILIAHRRTRAYWPNQEPDGSPPQCRSADAITGVGDPGGSCRTCPYGEGGWGSGKGGRGQACSAAEVWFLLRPDLFLPLVVKLPATSMTGAKKYRVSTLAARMLAPEQVVTSIKLESTKNPDGQAYSYAVPTVAGMLEPDEAARALEYANRFKGLFDAAAQAVVIEGDEPVAPAPAPETDEQRAERLAAKYGDTMPGGEEA